jgi:hypothetical protein
VAKNRINFEIDCPQPLELELPTPGGLRTMRISGVTTMALHASKEGGWLFTSAAMTLRENLTDPDASTLPEFDATKDPSVRGS